MTREALKNAWRETAGAAGLSADAAEAAWSDLARRYGEPGRAYHTLTHIGAMLAVVEEFAGAAADPLALRLAVWFHDAIYDARRTDNEAESAAYAADVLQASALTPPTQAAVERLILATQTHTAAPDDPDAALLLDADLAVLGAAPADYARYAQAIRQEYAWVPEDRYREGRRKVLNSFLERPRLYHTPALFARFEETARANLKRESEGLA